MPGGRRACSNKTIALSTGATGTSPCRCRGRGPGDEELRATQRCRSRWLGSACYDQGRGLVKLADDPREQGAYTLAEAATYAGISSRTASEWVRGRTARKAIGRKGAQGLIRAASRAPCLLSFINLVELFVLADLRRVHRVPMQRIRKALRYVERNLEIARPLVNVRFKTDGIDIFVEQLTERESKTALVNASADGQVAIRVALEARLARVEWDDAGIAARLFPLVRRDAAVQPRSIVMDPFRGFGRPVLAQTGIRTSVVADRFFAGESYRELAEDYGVPAELIEDAVRCENRNAA